MATPKILIKRSNVAGRVPTSLDSGELALNTADGKIYYTGHDGAIHAFMDSAGVNTLINNSVSTLDSGNVTDMIDSNYIQTRQITYTLPTLGNDFVDSAQVQAIINAAYVKNIIDSAYVASIVETDGDITITITNEITSTVDSAYVQARVDATDFLDSAEALALIDSAYILARADSAYIKTVTGIDADLFDGQNSTFYRNYNNLTNRPTILDNVDVENQIDSDYVRLRQDFRYSSLTGKPNILDSANVVNIINSEGLDSDLVTALVDSAYIQLRDRFQDSSLVTSTVDAAYVQARQIKYLDSEAVKAITLDSSEISTVVTSGYVQARQDFAYGSLTGAPTALSDFTNDVITSTSDVSEGSNLYFTNDRVRAISLDSEDATNLIDSAYIQARQTTGTDSAATIALITSTVDSAYVQLRETAGQILPSLGNDFVDSAEALKLIDANALDSGRATSLIDSAYVRIRVPTDQDLRTTSDVEFNKVNSVLDGAIQFTAKNESGATLTKGTVVYISGVSGTTPTVDKADADDASKMPAFGIVADDANDNSNVNVFTFGTLTGIDTSSFSAGDTLFVSTTAGELTNVKPAGEASLLQNIGRVIRSHASAGSIKVGGAGRTNAVPNLDNDQFFLGNDSNYAVAVDFTTTVQGVVDSAYVQLRQDFAYSSLTGAPTIPTIDTDFVDSARVLRMISNEALDSDLTIALVDSAYIQLRDRFQDSSLVTSTVNQSYVRNLETPNPVLGTDFVDSAQVELIVDSTYVQLRQTAQDFAYGSLTGTPVVFDSEMVDAIIDSNLFNGHGVRNVIINENNTTPTTNDGDVVAIGYDVGVGTGEKLRRSVIIGARSQNTDYNTQFNPQADANVVVGTYSHAESDATAIGHSVEAAIRSVVIGQDNGSISSNDSAVVLIGGGNNNQGPRSVAVGYRAGFFNRGEHNVLVGYSAGSVAGSDDDGYFGVADQGNRNVILGYQAFGNNGDNKIIIGYQAGGHNLGGIDSQTGNYIAIGDSNINRLIIPGLGIDTEDAVSGQFLKWTGTQFQFDSTAAGVSLGTDYIDSAQALILIDANALDSGRATRLIDSDYIRLHTRIGDSDIDFGSNKILYSNVYSTEGDLPSATTYHGMFAHVHGTGAGYFAHAGNWVRLANQSEVFDGTYASLTGKPDFFDSNDATILIDSAYVQARQTAGTDSAATIALIEATVDSAYVQLREAAGGGGGAGTVDSAQTIALIEATVDSNYVVSRVDSNYEKPISQVVYIYTADSGQTAFTDSDDNGLDLSFTSEQQLTIFLNGILLSGTSDVSTNSSTNTVTLTEAADSGDVLSIIKLSGAKPHIDSDMINNISLKQVTYVYTADSGQTAFTGADDNSNILSLADNARVSLNGILLLQTVDFTRTGDTVTLITAADSGDILTVEKFQGRDAALDSALVNNVAMSFTQYVYTADSGDTTFSGADDNGLTLAYTANRVRVHINGILQVDSADYTATNGTSVTLTEAADAGDVIQIEKFAGRDVGLDSGDIQLLIDSAYIQARQTDVFRDSGFVTTIIDSAYINARTEAGTDSAATIALIDANALDSGRAISLIDSAYVQARQITYTIPTLGNDFIDSAEAIRLITANAIDSGVALELLLDSIETIALIDSAYVQARQITYSIPVLGTDFVDSSEALKLIDANALDSGRAISLIDSDYVRLHTRIGDSDIDFGSNKILYSNVYTAEGDLPSATTYHGMFAHVHGTGAGYFAHAGNWVRLANQSEIFDGAYGSLTGTPALIDSALTIQLIDSAYVQARTTAGTDSASTIALITATVDSAYVALREANSGGGSGLDSSAIIALIDSNYVAAREADAGVGSGGTDSAEVRSIIADELGSTSNTIRRNVFTYEADSGDTVFTGADDNGTTLSVVPDNSLVFVNGILMVETVDYSLTSTTLTMTEEVDSGYNVTIVENVGKAETLLYTEAKFEYTLDSGTTYISGNDNDGISLILNTTTDNIDVFLNGVLLSETADYSIDSNSVTLVNGSDSADLLTVTTRRGQVVTPTVNTFEYTADSGQTAFSGADDNSSTLAYSSGAIQVHVNGILLRETDYTATNGSSVTLTEAADSGDDILISAFSASQNTKWTERTSSVTVSSNTKNIIDCSGGSITVTFPASPVFGDEIRIIDGTGNASTNNIVINRNGSKIQGAADNFIIDVNRAAVGFVYYNAAQGWILIEN